ncbi:MAG: sn-glycerol-3-phosphate ABC transporter ATP-binding protein UgpC [Bacilli bacterium]|jgi:multiple sugar transport system ATP-binding protein|nr:sn-glycerol-3-phosphate ABC transporter ATP-binding protein UgpC [Bacilli bacterium]NLN80323.1 sn-glycerol-3-phosphate ABC transporter ATP-binding protein UgpC [Erysipelotrichia bacterium]
MATITLKGVTKVYPNGVKAVKEFNLEIHDKEFVVFVGPSGCGKSTTLRMIAGLEDITEGEIFIDDKLVNNVHPRDRDIAMVFQNYALYPYMTVNENMGFGLKLRKVPKREIKEKVERAADVLGLKEYLDTKPGQLSGGQKQRVALGRAIVRNPKVFLLDEPLSNLDAKMRAVMRTELIVLHKQLQTTFVYVTHDQVEAMTMGSRIVVMKDGWIQQVDTPDNLYLSPTNKFVAGFIGTPQMNFIDIELEIEGEKMFACFGRYRLEIPEKVIKRLKEPDLDYHLKLVTLGIRAEEMSLVKEIDNDNYDNVRGSINVYEKLGNETLAYIDLRGAEDKLIVRAGSRFPFKIEDRVSIKFNMQYIHLFDYDSGESMLKRG